MNEATTYSQVPGERPVEEKGQLSGVLVYTIGLLLAAILTATSFWVANTATLWAGGIALGLAVLAIAQMGVQVVFFLHITSAPDNTNNVLALAFGMFIVFVVVTGSLWIMADLSDSMMPKQSMHQLLRTQE